MLISKWLVTLSAGALLGLSGCASTGTPERHQHLRDAKQGNTLPEPAAGLTVRKPLHDHREMK
jgi:hypothetical protein